MTLNLKNIDLTWFFGDFGCKRVNYDEMDGDRLRLPANKNWYRLSRVSWALLKLLVLSVICWLQKLNNKTPFVAFTRPAFPALSARTVVIQPSKGLHESSYNLSPHRRVVERCYSSGIGCCCCRLGWRRTDRIWYPRPIRDLLTPDDRTRPRWPLPQTCADGPMMIRALIPSTARIKADCWCETEQASTAVRTVKNVAGWQQVALGSNYDAITLRFTRSTRSRIWWYELYTVYLLHTNITINEIKPKLDMGPEAHMMSKFFSLYQLWKFYSKSK